MSFLRKRVSMRKYQLLLWSLISLGISLAAIVSIYCSLLFVSRFMAVHLSDGVSYLLPSLTAALLVGLPCWRHFVLKSERTNLWRGAWVGIFCCLIAHPIMWIIQYSLYMLVIIHHFPLEKWELDNISYYAYATLYAFVFDLLAIAWVSFIVAGIFGALMIWAQNMLKNHLAPGYVEISSEVSEKQGRIE